MLSAKLIAAIALTTSAALAQDECTTEPYGSCGSDAGVECCPEDYYCQPWDAGFYQCLPTLAKCPEQATNTDYPGNDLKTIYGVQPSECCDACEEQPDCAAYTFVNSNPGEPACYLKSAVGDGVEKIGAVSGILHNITAPSGGGDNDGGDSSSSSPSSGSAPDASGSTEGCETPKYGSCGNSDGAKCCPDKFFCVPWSPDYYQCVQTPDKCSEQETDVDYAGHDIRTVNVDLPSLCCDECSKTEGCKAYTYVNNNPGQPACYLKTSAEGATELKGAVSGKLD